MMESTKRSKKAIQVTYVGSFVNVLLTLAKFAAGFLGNSRAMIADAVHSMSDFITDIVVIAGLFVSSRPQDDNHDYGHGKFETLASMFIGCALFIVGIGIIYSSISAIYNFIHGVSLKKPGSIAIGAALFSVLAKEGLFRYTKIYAEKLKSSAMLANAWHHRSDAFSSIATLAGISASVFLGEKYRICDPLAGIAVSFFILKVAVSIVKENIDELMEASLDHELENEIMEIISGVSGAINPHNLRTRKIGDKVAIDIHIHVDPKLSIIEAHDISSEVEKALFEKFKNQTFVNVHIEPQK